MARRGLEKCDILYDISRLERRRAHCWNKESEPDNSDIFRLKRQIRKTKGIDEDYVQYLMLLLDNDEEPKCYTNEGGSEGGGEGGNEGVNVVRDSLGHDVDASGSEFDDEDEDEVDLEYKKFLANAKRSGNSYVVKMDKNDGFPVFLEFEKEDGSDRECGLLGQRKQLDSGDAKDLDNASCKDKLDFRPSSVVVENENGSDREHGLLGRRKQLDSGDAKDLEYGSCKDKLDFQPCKVVFEKDNGSDREYGLLGRREQLDSGDAKVLDNGSCKDKLDFQPFSTVFENANGSAGDNNVNIEPSDPVTRKEKELTNQKLSLEQNGTSKRHREDETKNGSNKEQKKRRGRKAKVTTNEEGDDVDEDYAMLLERRRKDETKNGPNKEQKKRKGRKAKVITKEEGDEVDEDYAMLLEKFICKRWSMTSSFMKKYNIKRKKSSQTVWYSDSYISEGDNDMTDELSEPSELSEPCAPPSPKIKRKRGRPRKNPKGDDASMSQEKGEKRKRAYKKKPGRKRKNLAVVPFAEDLAGTQSLDATVKEEIAVDEAPLKSGQDFECKDAADDLQIVVSDNCTFGKEGSSNLVEASSTIHSENVEDSCSRPVHSAFRENVKALLQKPYDRKEHVGLWKAVKTRKPTLKDMDLRNGKFYTSRRLGKSYLDHYKDLHERLKEVENNIRRLNILRGFFFWLQNLTQEGAFRPWTDPEWLTLVDNSIVSTLTSDE